MLTQIEEGILERESPLRVMGFDVNHRMTVMKLGNGDLLVHSPVELSEALQRMISKLGVVKWIAAPSRMHDLFLEEWMEAFPKAILVHSPGMKLKRLAPERLMALSDESGKLFGPEIECLLIRGMPRINEVAWLHKPSRSLIVADLMFNLTPATGLQRLLQRANGVYQRLGPSRLFRWLISDRSAFRGSMERVLSWDFDRVILGHGANIEVGGKQRVREAFAWLQLRE